MMGISIRQIAVEIGCSEDSLHTKYRQGIADGRARGGAVVKTVVWKLMLQGEDNALRHLYRALNNN